MSKLSAKARVRLLLGVGALAIIGGFLFWQSRRLPAPGSPVYQQMVSAFYSGVLALNVGDDTRAGTQLTRASQLVPREPASWVNLGLFYLQKNDLQRASDAAERAEDLAPDNGAIQALLGLLARTRGDFAAAAAHFRRAVELDPDDVRTRYTLVGVLQQQGGPDTDAEVQRQLEAIVAARPENRFAVLELASVAARGGDAALLRRLLAHFTDEAPSWPEDVRQQFDAVQRSAHGSDTRGVVNQLNTLRNLLVQVPAYQADRFAVTGGNNTLGAPLERFIVLESPPIAPAAPDRGTTFSAQPVEAPAGTAPWALVRPVWLGQDQEAVVLVANGREVRLTGSRLRNAVLPFPGGPTAAPPSPEGVLPVDWDNDYKVDLVLAGRGGLRLFRQGQGVLEDATAQAKLPAAVAGRAYTGVWAADIDSEGDLDLVPGVPAGPPVVLRNNGDRTFSEIRPFPRTIRGLRAFLSADIDGDGDADVALVDAAGALHVLENQRSGVFAAWTLPQVAAPVRALSAVDADRKGILDLVVLQADGRVRRLSRADGADGWDSADLAQWGDAPGDDSARLRWADLDNNGGMDLLATGSGGGRVWLSDENAVLAPLETPLRETTLFLDETGQDARIGLFGISPDKTPVRLANRGAKSYHFQKVRLRAQAVGDRRNNTYGLGAEIDLRAGLLFQKRLVTGPVTHFGLGDYGGADYIRILWPNGSPQGEFALRADQLFAAEERLVGSCPWLFAHDGRNMQFVTDFIWRSPLGLRINAQATAGVVQTRDRVKVRGDQLAARNGYYDLSITGELWETHFFDEIALLAVDHPVGTDVFVDERFAIPPPSLEIQAVSPPRPVARAVDDRGKDVSGIVRARDGRYLDTFGRGPFQGITRDHWVEVDLGQGTPADEGPLRLVAFGWIHPTDSSINVAISQGRHDPPQSLRVEVPDGRGGWRVARPDVGFPAGKHKTILIDLAGLFPPGAPRRLRLRTNLEIYWDQIAWARALPAKTPLRVRRIAPRVADLRYRGFSVTHTPDASSPEVPEYGRLAATGPRWLDLVGFHTRFGDVRPLLARTDDRYVIMNAGDEMVLRFPALPPPPPGWTRDFVFEGDGWEKDGNLNTGFSKTVLPLPSHSRPDYDTPPGRLEDDPVYRRHRRDWQTYHTRYVTPEGFRQALRPASAR